MQRRILYAMLNDLSLRPEGRFRKSAAVVGEVMGKYQELETEGEDTSHLEFLVDIIAPY